MAITDTLKDVLTVKLKPRLDGYTDQFSRIFLVKMMMIGALLVGLNWYNDKITCVIPGALGIDGGFVTQACWINGLYVYEDIRYHADAMGYYGVPRDIENNGMFDDGTLCNTHDKSGRLVPDCLPMEKTFYLQYQYLTFLLAALGIMYYAPYAFFRFINQDMKSLKQSIKEEDADTISKNYFNYDINPVQKLRARTLGNLIVKILYIISNVVTFLITDSILNGNFSKYGVNWTEWSKWSNEMAYDYMGIRHSPKPGNVLLPSFGLCEVYEAAKDVKNQVYNQHRFVCELSQHILYQYVFIILWFAMIFGIVISIVGLCMLLADHIMTVVCFNNASPQARKMLQNLTLRECQYLEYIRRKNMPLYANVSRKLREERAMVPDQKPIYRPSAYNQDQYEL